MTSKCPRKQKLSTCHCSQDVKRAPPSTWVLFCCQEHRAEQDSVGGFRVAKKKMWGLVDVCHECMRE